MTQTSRAAKLAVAVSERDHSSGPRDAPVTLLEYGDFECPFCGMAYPDLKRIQSRLGDQLRFNGQRYQGRARADDLYRALLVHLDDAAPADEADAASAQSFPASAAPGLIREHV